MTSIEYEMLSYVYNLRNYKLTLKKTREFLNNGVDINKRLNGKGQNMSLFENLAEFGVECPEVVALFIKKGGDLFKKHDLHNINVINTLFGNGEHECNWGRSSFDYEAIMDLIIESSNEKHYPEILNVLCTSPYYRGNRSNYATEATFLLDQLHKVERKLQLCDCSEYFQKAKDAYAIGPIVYFTEFKGLKLDDEYIKDLLNETEFETYDKIIELVKDNSTFFD